MAICKSKKKDKRERLKLVMEALNITLEDARKYNEDRNLFTLNKFRRIDQNILKDYLMEKYNMCYSQIQEFLYVNN